MKTYNAKLEFLYEASLGESPLWHAEHKALYFVDINNFKIISYNPNNKNINNEWIFDSYISTIVKFGKDALIGAVHNSFIQLSISTGTKNVIQRLDFGNENLRFNEGKCDSKGRIWYGVMDLNGKKNAGDFNRRNKDSSINRMISNQSIPNGFCWSLDNNYLYYIDSVDKCVKRYDYDEETGTITNPKNILEFSGKSLPDGMCIDNYGMLWIAFWGGSNVTCYDPFNGKQIAKINIPAPNVTSCCFGGNNLDKLFITTARIGLSDKQLKEFPLSGSVFSCNVDAKGFHSFNFQG